MIENKLTAKIKEAGQFSYQAELSTGEILMADDLMMLAAMLVRAGVTSENAFCGDWRETGCIGGSAISFKAEMRRLTGSMPSEAAEKWHQIFVENDINYRRDCDYKRRKRGLWMAAKTSSVSYRGEITEKMLEQAMVTGQAPIGFESHIGHFLDEAPIEIVDLAISEAARNGLFSFAEIWTNAAKLAEKYSYSRKDYWRKNHEGNSPQ